MKFNVGNGVSSGLFLKVVRWRYHNKKGKKTICRTIALVQQCGSV